MTPGWGWRIWPLGKKRLILITVPRRESFSRGIAEICAAWREIAETCHDVHPVCPVYLHPHVWEPVPRMFRKVNNISLTPPLHYLPLVYLMKHSYLGVTDSGGIPEALGIPTAGWD